MNSVSKKTIPLIYKQGVKNVGRDAKTLVSVQVGATSKKDVSNQLKKIELISKLSERDKPDIISDLSLENSESNLYKHIIQEYPEFIVSTLPIYKCKTSGGLIEVNELLTTVIQQIETGVSFITIHPTITKRIMDLAQNRLMPWTSRGGVMVIKDFSKRNFEGENIYLRILDEIIFHAKRHGVAISLGAAFRSANIFDSLDDCQIEEFKLQKKIADYIYERGVGVIIEGPGHSSPKNLKKIAVYYEEMGYPIMPLGPIPTDIAIGQDHISSVIGATILGMFGSVDILTSVTREEHTGKIPTIESSIEAIRASRIAAHVLDLNKLDTDEKDRIIVRFRTDHQTCIYGKMNSGCSRCSHVCPLQFTI
jgi:phosphomethylpyrimidine synthase